LFNKKDEFTDWEVGEEYKIIRLIGSGSYGSVVEATHIATNTRVAIKRMEDIFADNEDCKKMVREIKLLMCMNQSNYITKILDIIEPKNLANFKNIYVVLEYVDTDLRKVLKSSIKL
jgi:mitogen-activated protein kinase 1/3